jgi:predicted flap endonuclease-1-like 5' DNA nuclease
MNTNVILAFVIGLLIGWVIEWIIDFVYWRKKFKSETETLQIEVERLRQQNADFNEKVTKIETENQDLRAEIKNATPTQADATPEKVETVETETRSAAPIVVESEPKSDEEVVPDDLTKIKGVGAVIQQKLNVAGIFTYSQLGALSPAQLEEVVGEDIKRLANEEALINRAKILAGDLIPDKLSSIKGIGPVIEKKLNEAGIYTYAHLGTLTPADLEAVVGEGIKRLADEDELIRQARELAGIDNQIN